MSNDLFRIFDQPQRSTAEVLHAELMRIEPGFSVGPAWSGIGYKQGSNYSCLVAAYDDHIKLMIWRGVDLDDPAGVLAGSGKNTRHIRYESPDDIDVGVLRKLLAQQFALYASGVSYEDPPKRRSSTALPAFVREALEQQELFDVYKVRPDYQRRDYVSWITGAKRESTQLRRLDQMLDELRAGDVYMKMPWGSKSRR